MSGAGQDPRIEPGRSCRPEANLSSDEESTHTREAIEAWTLATIPRALAYARSLLRDRSRGEDVVHDCYVRLLRKGEAYDLLADGTKLLFKAITNACIDINTRERRLESLDEPPGGRQGEPPWSSVDRRALDPHELAAHREFEAALAEGLRRLPVAQRAALELKSLGYSLEEIAEALGTSPSNAGVLVHRARKALAARLAHFLGNRSHEET